MKDRRRFQRRHLVNYSRLFDRNAEGLIGHLLDITPKGIGMISEDPLEINATFQFKMYLPTKIEGVEEIVFDVRSVWCNPGTTPNTYESGFEILKISAKDLEVVRRLVQDYGYQELVSLLQRIENGRDAECAEGCQS